MGRGKHVVKVLLSPQQHEILKCLAQRLGISESEAVRTALMEYAKTLGLLAEYIQKQPNNIGGKA